MLFNSLLTLMQRGDTLVLTIGRVDASDNLHVTVTPRLAASETGELSKLLSTPIQVTGTADELDVELPAHLKAHGDRVMSLRGTFQDLDKKISEAEKGARQKLTPPAPATPATPPENREPALF